MAAKAKRKQRRRQPGSAKGQAKQKPVKSASPAQAVASAPPSGDAKPLKRLERQAQQTKRRARDNPQPHKLDIRHGVERPKAIWDPFPLTGIAGLIGFVLLVIGFAQGPEDGLSFISAGGFIMTVAVGEMCLREHLAGFRSHSLLLGFLPVLATQLFVYYLITDAWIGPIALFVDATVFAVLVLLLHGKYRSIQRAAQEKAIAAAKKRRR